MNEFLVVLWAVLPVFSLIAVGGMARRVEWLTEEADHSLLRVTINILVPCFILDKVLGNEALRQAGNVLLAPTVGAGTVALGILIAVLAVGATGLTDQTSRRTFGYSTGIYNWGYMPLPLAMTLFDRETVGVLIVHNLGTEIAFWSIGAVMLSGLGGGSIWKKILNPPMAAIVIALTLNFTNAQSLVPQFLLTTAKLLGDCAIPMGLVLIGATIADHIHEFHFAKGGRVIATACVLRLGVLPVLFLLLAKYLPCSVELKRVIVLQSAMPTAVFNVIMAKHYGGDTATAIRIVISTTVVSMATIPLWLKFGMKFVGL
ncbi:MAG: AEC family transporter [Verrucomicrobiota bacterium]